MLKCNPSNERIKRKYLEWQKEAKQKSQSTIDNIRKAIDRFDSYTKQKNFKSFNKHQAIAFKKELLKKDLSKSTLLNSSRILKDFFIWLAYQKGYKRLSIQEVEYFNLSEKETRIAKTPKRQTGPSIEQVEKVIFSMPDKTDMEKRDRALIAFTILTGIRDGAMASLCLKHVHLDEELVIQDGAEVKTKFSKTIYTYFFPVDEGIKKVVIDWIKHLQETKLFNPNDPLFPRTKLALDKNNSFYAAGIEPKHWESANQIRQIFKKAFTNAGIDYFPPHSFRNTLVRLGEGICQTPEEFKVWSQNLGHEQPLTTFVSYGYVPEFRQGEIIKNLGKNRPSQIDQQAILKRMATYLDKVESEKEITV